MKTLTFDKIRRAVGSRNNTQTGGGSGGTSGGGGTVDYAEEAGHATSADSATTAATATNLDANSTDWQKIMRKDIAQTAAEVITFAKGIVSTLVSKFKAGIQIGPNDQFGIDVNGDTTVRDISARDITTDGNVDADGNGNFDGHLTVGGNAQAAAFIANIFKTLGYSDAWLNMIGKGFGVKVDSNGQAYLQTDNLLVLGQMIVNSLNIREVSFIGGTYLLTPAGSTVTKVQKLYALQTSQIQYSQYWTTTEGLYSVGYRLLWKADDGTTGTMNYWNAGDQAFCQTYNITQPGQYTTAANRRYWRLVVRVGQVTIDGETFHYADVADIDAVYIYGIPNAFVGRENSSGSIPVEGDKVVCLGSQTDTTRQGAIQLTAEGEASIGIYDGINNFTALSNFEIHYFSKSAVRMNAAYITWKTTSGNQTQASFMADTKSAFIHVGNCGLDLTNDTITAKGGKFQMEDENGNPTFVLDQDGNLNSEGDAAFGGTIRAKNFYHGNCIFAEGTSALAPKYSFSRYYCLRTFTDADEHTFIEGEYYTYEDVEYSDLSNFTECTYSADVIIMIPDITSQWGGTDAKKTVYLPDPKDFVGKLVRIKVFNYGSSTRTAVISCVVSDKFAYKVAFDGVEIRRETTSYNNLCPITAGTEKMFYAIESNDGYGHFTYYWLEV